PSGAGHRPTLDGAPDGGADHRPPGYARRAFPLRVWRMCTPTFPRGPKLRSALDGIPTYKPGRPAAPGAVTYKLSSNENPYPPLPGVLEQATRAAGAFNRYPDMACTALLAEIADHFGVPVTHLATGTGSVGVAQQLLQATAGPGD